MSRLVPTRFMQAVLLVAALCSTGCYGQYTSDAPIAKTSKPIPSAEASAVGTYTSATDSVSIDPDRSEVAWQGTKMWGRGRHTGIVPIKDGVLTYHGDRLVGGAITIDMTSIGITDIPADQPEPIRILTGHLEDPLFFDVEKYPEARFVITDVTASVVTGHLTIKDVTRSITVPYDTTPAEIESDDPENAANRLGYETVFRFNRFEWNIAYEGGFGATRFAARNFVDKYIELTITLRPVTPRPIDS